MVNRSGEETAGSRRVMARYRSLVTAGEITADPAQLAAARRLDRLDNQVFEASLASKPRALGWLFARRPVEPVRGLYIFGSVGRGKTMLMDAFYAVAAIEAKRRTHFHTFMADVHERIHAFQVAHRAGTTDGDDPIAPVAAAIAAEIRLLCLDEFAVEDIADAMILARLFTALFDRGLTLVATSNTAPGNLYLNGLNRPLFLPFIAVLQNHVDVLELKTEQDYRLAKLGAAGAYVTPIGSEARTELDGVWRSLLEGRAATPATLTVKGRSVSVPRAGNRAARFAFADLCEAPLGTADFAAIADAFDTVVIDDIPVIAAERRDVARRFINLIDVFYDAGVRIVVSAASEPDALYPAADGAEASAFRRTASRLIEMRSAAYLDDKQSTRDARKSVSSRP